METKMTEQESLQLITRMVQQAQNNFQKGAGNLMIFWGYLVAFTALLNFVLAYLGNKSCLVWFLMIPGWLVTYFMLKKIDRTAMVKTHVERIYNSIWAAFGISIVILQFVFWAMYYYFGATVQFNMMAPVILIFCGSSQFISGMVYRFRPYTNGGYIFWLGAIVCLIILPKVPFHFLVLTICMVFAYIIPGLKLNKKAKENV